MKPEVEELSDSRSGPLAFLAVALELTKPRLTLLVLISSACGWLAARTPQVPLANLPWIDLLNLIIGLAFVGAASNIVNQAMEHRLDALMERTKDRPVPSGRISVMSTYILGHVCLLIGRVLQFDHRQGQTVQVNHHIRAAVVLGALDRQLVHHQPVIGGGVVKSDDLETDADLLVPIHIGDG